MLLTVYGTLPRKTKLVNHGAMTPHGRRFSLNLKDRYVNEIIRFLVYYYLKLFTQVFSCEFCGILMSNFFYRTPLVVAFETITFSLIIAISTLYSGLDLVLLASRFVALIQYDTSTILDSFFAGF